MSRVGDAAATRWTGVGDVSTSSEDVAVPPRHGGSPRGPVPGRGPSSHRAGRPLSDIPWGRQPTRVRRFEPADPRPLIQVRRSEGRHRPTWPHHRVVIQAWVAIVGTETSGRNRRDQAGEIRPARSGRRAQESGISRVIPDRPGRSVDATVGASGSRDLPAHLGAMRMAG